MHARFFASLAVLHLGLTTLVAVPDPAADLKARVKELVEQLGNSAKQVSAETELLKLGPDILPLLPDPATKLTPAQKERLKSIRATLQEAQVLKDMAPRIVSLQNQAISLSKALEQLKDQSSIEVVDRRQAVTDDPPLKLNLQKVTFWQALDAIAREADLVVSLYEKDGKIALRDGPHRALPVSYSGMFRIVARRLTSVRDLETEAHLCNVLLEIAWEPRFQPLFLHSHPENLVVQDDKGVALKAPENGGNGRTPLLSRITTEVSVLFEAPRRAVNSLGLLKGSFSVIGPSKMLNFTFDTLGKIDKKNPPTKTQEGVTVKMREFTTESDLWTVGFLLEYPAEGPDFESFESWLVNNEIFLENKAGRRFSTRDYNTDEQGGHRAIVTYHFVEENDLKLDKEKPADWKLIYRTPGRIAKVPIHFEFKDLPLP